MVILKPTYALMGLFTIVAILAIAPSAFAETAEITIAKGAGASANADCVSANNCFSPNPTTVSPGTEVEWNNVDSVSHTVTSGKVSDDNSGSMFDSGLVKPGKTFDFTFADAGTYSYFCTVHPWMTGQVIVSGSTTTNSQSSDNTVNSGSMNMTAAQPNSGSTETTNNPPTSTQAVTTTNMQLSDNAQTTSSQPAITNTMPVDNTTQATQPTSTYAPAQPAVNNPQPAAISTSAPTASTSSDSSAALSAWIAGIVIFAIMSGVGVWSAVRR